MPFNVDKYLGSVKKKHFLKDVIKIKLYAHKKKTVRKNKEWEAKYAENSPTKIDRAYTWAEEREFFSNIRGWKQFIIAMFQLCLILSIPYLLITYWESVVGILLLILYGIGCLIGIVLAFIGSKLFICFLYKQFVNTAAKFVADVLKEVDKKQEENKQSLTNQF